MGLKQTSDHLHKVLAKHYKVILNPVENRLDVPVVQQKVMNVANQQP